MVVFSTFGIVHSKVLLLCEDRVRYHVNDKGSV